MEDSILDQGLCELHAGPTASHPRSIIHIDVDCFYAQVEMLNNPELRNVPIGIQQKHCIVTSNYPAREFGIKKCMSLENAYKLCPQLVLVNGEDLSNYRKMSLEIFNTLQTYGIPVERLGMDENFLDVSTLIEKESADCKVAGHLYGDGEALCPCGCRFRLTIASNIAQEIRNKLVTTLGITCCAGIAHNKLLAKIVGSFHKPNQQTTVFPENAVLLMSTLQSVRNIPGIGTKSADALTEINIQTVADLQKAEFTDLKEILGINIASTLKNWSLGVDITAVKQSTKPQSIGLEDTFKTITSINDVTNKIKELLNDLIDYMIEDGRIPQLLKLSIRKPDDKLKYHNFRSSRQTSIPPTIFVRKLEGVLHVSTNSYERLLSECLRLFRSMIDVSSSFEITLLGLAFSKFMERAGQSSVVSHIARDIELE